MIGLRDGWIIFNERQTYVCEVHLSITEARRRLEEIRSKNPDRQFDMSKTKVYVVVDKP